MDKETLSNYGWIVICVLVMVVMIALATPFGSFVSEAVQSTTKGLFDVNKSALDSTGLINIDNQEFDVPDMNHSAANGGNTGDVTDVPQQSEHGFYYDKPYYFDFTGHVDLQDPPADHTYAFVLRNDGSAIGIDLYGGGPYSVQSMDISCEDGVYNFTLMSLDITGTFSADGLTFICSNIHVPNSVVFLPGTDIQGITFALSEENVFVDSDYVYKFDTQINAWVVFRVINGTKSSYAPIRSTINGKPVVSVDFSAFSNNSNLTSIPTMPASLKTIDFMAFYNCTGIRNAVISEGVTTIDEDAFADCTNLTSITLPNSITTIYETAFYGCSKLTNINFNGTMNEWNSINLNAEHENHIGFSDWNKGCPEITVTCTDGTITIPANN